MESDDDKPKPPRDDRGHFPKGVSGNPGGRATGTAALTHAYRDLLETACPDDRSIEPTLN